MGITGEKPQENDGLMVVFHGIYWGLPSSTVTVCHSIYPGPVGRTRSFSHENRMVGLFIVLYIYIYLCVCMCV